MSFESLAVRLVLLHQTSSHVTLAGLLPADQIRYQVLRKHLKSRYPGLERAFEDEKHRKGLEPFISWHNSQHNFEVGALGSPGPATAHARAEGLGASCFPRAGHLGMPGRTNERRHCTCDRTLLTCLRLGGHVCAKVRWTRLCCARCGRHANKLPI